MIWVMVDIMIWKKKKKNTESDKEMKEMKPLKLLVIQNMMDKRRISFNDLQVFWWKKSKGNGLKSVPNCK